MEVRLWLKMWWKYNFCGIKSHIKTCIICRKFVFTYIHFQKMCSVYTNTGSNFVAICRFLVEVCTHDNFCHIKTFISFRKLEFTDTYIFQILVQSTLTRIKFCRNLHIFEMTSHNQLYYYTSAINIINLILKWNTTSHQMSSRRFVFLFLFFALDGH